MARTCTICDHPDRQAIDAAMVNGDANRAIARQYRVSKDAVARHKSEHLPGVMVKSKKAADVLEADSLLDRLRSLNRETAEVLADVKRVKDHDLWLKAIARAEKQIELEGRLIGELKDQQVINIAVNPQWVTIRTTILTALQGYPEARESVIRSLVEADGHAALD